MAVPRKVSRLPSREMNPCQIAIREGCVGGAHSQVGLWVLFFQKENKGLSRAHWALPPCGPCFQPPSNGCIPSPGLIFDLDMPSFCFPLPFWTQLHLGFSLLPAAPTLNTPQPQPQPQPMLSSPPGPQSLPPPTACLLLADGSSAGYYLSELLLAHMLIKTRCPKSLGTICSVICSL